MLFKHSKVFLYHQKWGIAQTLTRNKIKNLFFDISVAPPGLVSTALSVRFYELNGAQSHFPPLSLVVLSPSSPPLSLGQFDSIMYLKHLAWFQWRLTRVFSSKLTFSCWIMLPWVLTCFPPLQMFPINLFNTFKREIKGKISIKQLKHKTKQNTLNLRI